jgi:nucleoid-associated protein EbfC
MFNKLKQFKDMRDQAKQMKEMLDEVMVVGSGAGGNVMITLNGSHEPKGVQIAEGMDKAKIEIGVKDAIIDANRKLQTELMKKMQSMDGGLDALKGMLGQG